MTLRSKLAAAGVLFCALVAALVATLLWGSATASEIRDVREVARARIDACLELGAALHLAQHVGTQEHRAEARRALARVEVAFGEEEASAELDTLRRAIEAGPGAGRAAGPEDAGADAMRRLVERARRLDLAASETTRRAIRTAQRVAIAVAIAALLAAAAAAIWIAPRVRRGLSALEAGAARLAAGRLDVPIDLDGADELAVVAAGIDALAARLRETAHGADHLEALVRERTSELERSRAELAGRVAQLEAARSHLGAADRLASVGKLARGLAHEVNNPLAVVRANLDYLAEELCVPAAGSHPDVRAAIGEANGAARRVSQIVHDLMAFARDGGNEAGAADLALVVAHVDRLVGHELRGRARFEVTVPPGPLLVQGSASKLGQVLTHLLLDAASAIPEGARDAHRIALRVVEEAAAIRVEVQDTGAPIPRELLPHLFDPYYTPTQGFATDTSGRTTGLGLAVCFGLVEAAGGTIAAESAPATGTTFRVTFRRATSETRVTLQPAAAAARGARPRLLVVDDDPLVCASLYRVLSSRFDVVPHTSARSALGLVRANERFDAILCDLSMPDMSGMDFHREVRSSHPAAADAIIFLTGGAFTPEAAEFLERVPNARAEKPFVPSELTQLILSRLAPRAPAANGATALARPA